MRLKARTWREGRLVCGAERRLAARNVAESPAPAQHRPPVDLLKMTGQPGGGTPTDPLGEPYRLQLRSNGSPSPCGSSRQTRFTGYGSVTGVGDGGTAVGTGVAVGGTAVGVA